MACLKDEVKRTSSRSRIFVYEDDLQFLDPDDRERDLEKILDYSRDAFLTTSSRLTELGLKVVDSPLEADKIVVGAPKDLENGRKVVPLSISTDLYSKIQERRGELWVADFLDIVIGYRKDMAKLEEQYGGHRSKPRNERSGISQYDSDDEEEEEDEYSENEPVSVGFLGMKVDFDKTSRILWILGMALFGVGDTATTYWSLMKGNVETNPILAFLIGMNPLVMISFKIAIICGFYIFYYIMKNRHGKDANLLWIPAIMIILGGYLTINNYLVIIRT
ncbi:MAG TPA: DUF5658 family protein [Methanomassiliicoccales archaeon]|jgi:hypothetical protein